MFDIFDWVNSKCLRVREFIESTLDTQFILVYIQGNKLTKFDYTNIGKLAPMDPDIFMNINTIRYKSNSIGFMFVDITQESLTNRYGYLSREDLMKLIPIKKIKYSTEKQID